MKNQSRIEQRRPAEWNRRERVKSARRELIDHVIVLNEKHIQRLLREYVDDYNADRVHTELQDSPTGRPTEHRPSPEAKVVGLPPVGGLHHRCKWQEAA